VKGSLEIRELRDQGAPPEEFGILDFLLFEG